MAPLPDPTPTLDGAQRAAFDHMAGARAGAEGRAALGDVYVRMFNNPTLATRVGAVGEAIRFAGVLPGDVRELCILRFAERRRVRYEWAHHVRPAHLAGLDDAILSSLGRGDVPAGLRPDQVAALSAVDAVLDGRSIPADVQDVLVRQYGTAGVVELVVLCGLYTIMAMTVASFDIAVEEGLPAAPF